MKNKILIVEGDVKEREALEKILIEIVEEGGELIFATNRESGLQLLKTEHPVIAFIDAAFEGKKTEWDQEGTKIVMMRRKHELQSNEEDCVLKPLKTHPVIEKCRSVLVPEPADFRPPSM